MLSFTSTGGRRADGGDARQAMQTEQMQIFEDSLELAAGGCLELLSNLSSLRQPKDKSTASDMINDAIVELARNRYLFHIDLMHHQIIHLLHALLIVNAML